MLSDPTFLDSVNYAFADKESVTLLDANLLDFARAPARDQSDCFKYSSVYDAIRGDSAARETLLAWVRPKLTLFALSRLYKSVDASDVAEDVAQDALIRILEYLPRCRAKSTSQFLAWAASITHRLVVDRFRNQFDILSPTRSSIDALAPSQLRAATCSACEPDGTWRELLEGEEEGLPVCTEPRTAFEYLLSTVEVERDAFSEDVMLQDISNFWRDRKSYTSPVKFMLIMQPAAVCSPALPAVPG